MSLRDARDSAAPGIEAVLRKAIYLTGATATGKTAVGIALAGRIGAEIVSMDSMTLYRGMDIGTAKPGWVERAGIPHHVIDMRDPWEGATVADYRGWALNAAEEIDARGKRILFVGGTPLYLKAMLRGLFAGPEADPHLRQELEARTEVEGEQAMHAELARLDPATAARLHPRDRRRVIRALEVYRLTGQPISTWQGAHEKPTEGVCVLALQRGRDQLRDRITRRVVGMFEQGLVEEVERLHSLHVTPAQAAGYREVLDYFAGKHSLEEAVTRTERRTHQLAKRQETWFRNLAEVEAYPVLEQDEPADVAEALIRRIQES